MISRAVNIIERVLGEILRSLHYRFKDSLKVSGKSSACLTVEFWLLLILFLRVV